MNTVTKRSSSASTSRFRPIETEWEIDAQSFEVHLAVPDAHLAVPEANLAVLETHHAVPKAHLAVPKAHIAVAEAHIAVPEAHLTEQSNAGGKDGELLKYSEHVYTISEEDLLSGSSGGYY